MEIFMYTSTSIYINSINFFNDKTINLIDGLCNTNNLTRKGNLINGDTINLYNFLKELTEYTQIILE